MTFLSRRRFLQHATTAGAARSADSVFGRFSWAQTTSGADAGMKAADAGRQMRYVDHSLNRDLSKAREVELHWEDHAPSRVVDSQILTGDDLKASNSFEAPQRVKPQSFEKPSTTNMLTRFEAPPRSYCVIQWSY